MTGAAPRETVFRIRGLSKIYRKGEVEVPALRGIDLDIADGELLVLLGHSGSGKSTLLNVVGGLDTPTSGTVFYRDQDLTHATDAALTLFRRDRVGFVFQFYNLIPSLTALENVELVTEIAQDPLPAAEALRLVGLVGRLDHFPAQMSGGEQQRVAIARAIAKRPEVLLCDEPTGALDITTGSAVLEAIATVNAELKTTVVIITHNAAIAEMADRVITLSDGRIAGARENPVRQPVTSIRW
jgi:putative ABC transport system ATP-binding protein